MVVLLLPSVNAVLHLLLFSIKCLKYFLLSICFHPDLLIAKQFQVFTVVPKEVVKSFLDSEDMLFMLLCKKGNTENLEAFSLKLCSERHFIMIPSNPSKNKGISAFSTLRVLLNF